MRNSLIIIPISKPGYKLGMSAPLSWMFSDFINNVMGIYSYELNDYLISNFEFFIIELNWFTELYEVILLINKIKNKNYKNKIMIGGLYSSMIYEKMIKEYNVNYYIKGDLEIPIQEFINGNKINNIQNIVYKTGENKHTYMFKEHNYKNLNFDISWFKTYENIFHKNNIYNTNISNDERNMVCPMVITSKGGCTTCHDGCDYCMGSKHKILKKIYNRKAISISENNLRHVIRNISNKYNVMSLYITSPYVYNLNEYFDVECNIEIDSPITANQIFKLSRCFKKSKIWLPISNNGVMSKNNIISNIDDYIATENYNHKIKFLTYNNDKLKVFNKDKYMTNNLDTVFSYQNVNYNNYSNFNHCFKFSRSIYNRSIKWHMHGIHK